MGSGEACADPRLPAAWAQSFAARRRELPPSPAVTREAQLGTLTWRVRGTYSNNGKGNGNYYRV